MEERALHGMDFTRAYGGCVSRNSWSSAAGAVNSLLFQRPLFAMNMSLSLSTFAAVSMTATVAVSAAEVKPPEAQYWMDVATMNTSIPGMPAGMSFGGMGGGPQRTLNLYLLSRRKAAAPEAQHDIPLGQNMGPALPLLLPHVERDVQRGGPGDRQYEKPKARLLVYWGCGEEVRSGQPRVADTEKMSLEQFAQVLSGRTPPNRGAPYGPGRAIWPNERDSKPVPATSSLLGDHFVHGNYTPDIRFQIGRMQDFLQPVALAAAGPLSASVKLDWQSVPTAQGYFATGMAHREKTNETILWSSSELPETGFGLMDYLPNDYLRRLITDKVVMGPGATSCAIPKGIFEGVEGAMVRMIAYGEELNLAHPPRPSDPKAVWEPIWTARVRVKSIGMTPIGMADDGDRPRRRAAPPAPSEAVREPTAPPEGQEGRAPAEGDAVKDTVNKLRGIFGF